MGSGKAPMRHSSCPQIPILVRAERARPGCSMVPNYPGSIVAHMLEIQPCDTRALFHRFRIKGEVTFGDLQNHDIGVMLSDQGLNIWALIGRVVEVVANLPRRREGLL
jgi:hypothetical protein